jgi:hypothetical protein
MSLELTGGSREPVILDGESFLLSSGILIANYSFYSGEFICKFPEYLSLTSIN